MKISLIIPAFNEEKLIAATLASIRDASLAFTHLGWQTELVVCDNNSTDRTAELARAAGATVIFEPVNQIARARNRGAFAATGDWFIFIDADSHPGADLFADVAHAITHQPCLGGGATVQLDENHFFAGLLVHAWNLLSRVRRWAAGSFIFVQADAFRAIGGFSNELFASEEIDLSERLKKHARSHGKQLVILHRHPLVTSARKLHLYTPWEYARFLLRGALMPGRTLRSRTACQPWYDGRR